MIRQLAKRGLHAAGYYDHRLAHQQLPGVAVLCFHGIRQKYDSVPFAELHVTKGTFEGVCRTVARTCSPVSLDHLRAARDAGTPLPPRPVLFTFDDGYASVLTRALPVLERFNIPATVFVTTDAIQQRRHFWFDALCQRHGEQAVAYARSLPYDDWASIVAAANAPVLGGEAHRPLSELELRRLAEHPLIEIAAHTVSHPVLSKASAAQQFNEIAGSRAALVAMTGADVRAFAYPFGDPVTDFAQSTVDAVAAAGLDFAFSTTASFAGPGDNPLVLPRFVMLESIGAAEIAHRLSHSWLRRAATESPLARKAEVA